MQACFLFISGCLLKKEDKTQLRLHGHQPALHSSCVVMTQTISSSKQRNLYFIDNKVGLPTPSSLPTYPALCSLSFLCLHTHTKRSFIHLLKQCHTEFIGNYFQLKGDTKKESCCGEVKKGSIFSTVHEETIKRAHSGKDRWISTAVNKRKSTYEKTLQNSIEYKLEALEIHFQKQPLLEND